MKKGFYYFIFFNFLNLFSGPLPKWMIRNLKNTIPYCKKNFLKANNGNNGKGSKPFFENWHRNKYISGNKKKIF